MQCQAWWRAWQQVCNAQQPGWRWQPAVLHCCPACPCLHSTTGAAVVAWNNAVMPPAPVHRISRARYCCLPLYKLSAMVLPATGAAAGAVKGSVPAAVGWGLLFAVGSVTADFFGKMAGMAFQDMKPYGPAEKPAASKALA